MNRPGRACVKPGCAGVVRNGACSVCGVLRNQAQQRQADERRGSAASRGYDRRWRKVRNAFLSAHPLCADCLTVGRVTPATEPHHKIARRDRGDDSDDNLVALCKACHSVRTGRGE